MDFAKPENAKSAMAGSDGYTLEITLEKGIHIRLDISGPDPDNQRWATVNGGPLRGRVFSLNNHATTTVMKVRADLIQ